MRTMMIAIGLAALTMLAGCSVSEAQTAPVPLTEKQAKLLEKEIGGRTPGAPVRCISKFGQPNVIRVSDDTLLYRVSGRLVYQNKLLSPCPGLARDLDVIVSEQFGSQQCRGDLLRLVDRVGGIPGPVCVLGDFVPYRKDATGL
jgi:hypothetical protein